MNYHLLSNNFGLESGHILGTMAEISQIARTNHGENEVISLAIGCFA